VNLEEVKLLANEMTLKYSFYNLRIGGAKAGICCPFPMTVKEKEEIFFNFGKSLKTLLRNRIYYAGTDIGTNQNDVHQLYKGAGMKQEKDPLDSSYYTAISVISALKTMSSFTGMALNGARIGIQGLGRVGTHVLRFASDHGLKLVAVSTQRGALYEPNGLDVTKIFDLARKMGDDFVSHYNGAKQIPLEDFFEKDMDIMCPCAGIYPIHPGNVQKIKAKTIVVGCNVAAVNEVEKLLHKREITYLPGFVSNAGGVLGNVLKRVGIEDEERDDFLSRGIESRVVDIMTQAKRSGEPHADIAYSMASKNQEKFNLDSKLQISKNRNLSIKRLQSSRAARMLRTIVFYMFRHKLIFPNFVGNHYKKIVFERLFTS
jgi:glutamate dehydrogenase/leucine dehydrogenase